MKFEFPLQKGKWIKRYKRFMVDVALENGETLTVHSANTGSMKNCYVEGGDVWFWDSQNDKRKYPHSLELCETPSGDIACINTSRPNYLVVEAIKNGVVTELQDYKTVRTEVRYGHEKSRIDILLEGGDKSIYVEVKNCTLMENNHQGFFPDAVSDRASKHLRELMLMVEQGHRAAIFFCVNHTGIQLVQPADHIDPKYGELLREAANIGVEVLAYRAKIEADSISLVESLPVLLSN